MQSKLTHINKEGKISMVNVGKKPVTQRVAKAEGIIFMSKEALDLAKKDKSSKGSIISTATIAGIMAAKQTSNVIPLCHHINLDKVDIDFEFLNNGIKVSSSIFANYKTGAEMEALHAVSIACLTIYDMLKAVDKSMKIDSVKLTYKEGGKSGVYKEDESES